MSNENHNNFAGWKIKLEELNHLPGQSSMDSNAGWEKLHARIGRKKHNKKIIWYWTAAACSLIAILIPVLYHNNRTFQISARNIKETHAALNNSSNINIDKKDSLQNIQSLLITNKEVASREYVKKITNIIHKKQTDKMRLYDTVTYQNVMAETKDNSLAPLDTFVSLTANIAVKKKWRVIQINELGDPVESEPSLVRNTGNHSFQFLFANQEIFSNPAVASSEKGFTILKIKTSPN